MSKMWGLLIVCCLFSTTVSNEDWEPELKYTNKDNWVDPGDMMNYDSHTKTMRNSDKDKCDCDLMEEKLTECIEQKEKCELSLKECHHHQQQSSQMKQDICQRDCDCNKLQTTVNQCEENKESIQKLYQDCLGDKGKNTVSTGTQTCKELYFKQFITSLVNQMSSKVQGDEPLIKLEYLVQLTSEGWSTLNKFVGSDDGNLYDAHDVLSHMVQRIQPTDKPINTWRLWLEDFSGTDLQTLVSLVILAFGIIAFLIVIIAVPTRYGYSWQRQIFRTFIVLFVISVPWTWVHLYKTEVAKKHSKAMTDIPEHCKPGGSGVWSGMNEWFRSVFTFSGDTCTAYHEALMVDPFWDVPPTQAIVVTISKFVLKPLEHLGEAIGKFFNTLYKDLPIQVWPIATFVLIVVIILFLIMMFGYSIRFPFIGGIEAPRHQHERLTKEERLMIENAPVQIAQLEQANEELQKENQDLQEDLHQMQLEHEHEAELLMLPQPGGGDANIEHIQDVPFKTARENDDGPPNKKSKLEEPTGSVPVKYWDPEKKTADRPRKTVHEPGSPTKSNVSELYFPDKEFKKDTAASPEVEPDRIMKVPAATKSMDDLTTHDLKSDDQVTPLDIQERTTTSLDEEGSEVTVESAIPPDVENIGCPHIQDSEIASLPEKDPTIQTLSSVQDLPSSEVVSSSSEDIDVIEQKVEEQNFDLETPSMAETAQRVVDLAVSPDDQNLGATASEEARPETIGMARFEESILTKSTEVISRSILDTMGGVDVLEPFGAKSSREQSEHSESDDDFVVLRKESMDGEPATDSPPSEGTETVDDKDNTEHNISALSLD